MPKIIDALNSSEKNALLAIFCLAAAQIIACVIFSRITGVPLSPSEPEYWLRTFNHIVSIAILVTVLLYWINPMRNRLNSTMTELDAHCRKNAEIGEVLRGHIGWQFKSWGLTPSECDVALLSLKGLRISEIAEYRSSREGTVKAHLNAIFKKANVSSRPELLATCLESFIELGCPTQDDDAHLTNRGRVILNGLAQAAS